MIRNLLFSILLFFTFNSFAQVEVPIASDCKLFSKNNFSYCVNPTTYKVQWTAAILYRPDIANKTYSPPDKEFFKDIPQQISQTWVNIENQVKYWSIEFDSIYVVTGKTEIFTDSITPPKKAYYKALLKGCQGDAIAFLVKEDKGGLYLKDYIISIDELEQITGMDYFHKLDESLQEIIEAEYNLEFWPITDFTSMY